MRAHTDEPSCTPGNIQAAHVSPRVTERRVLHEKQEIERKRETKAMFHYSLISSQESIPGVLASFGFAGEGGEKTRRTTTTTRRTRQFLTGRGAGML